MGTCLFCPKHVPEGRLPDTWGAISISGRNGESLKAPVCPRCSAEILSRKPPRLYEIIGFAEKKVEVKPHSNTGKVYLPREWVGGEVTCILTKRPGDGA